MSDSTAHDRGGTTGGEAGAAKSPEELRAEIEETREQLGDTVEQLAAKTDVKAQAKSRVSALRDTAQAKTQEFVTKTKDATPDSAGAGAAQLSSTVSDKPVPFALGGTLLAGVAIGWLLGRR